MSEFMERHILAIARINRSRESALPGENDHTVVPRLSQHGPLILGFGGWRPAEAARAKGAGIDQDALHVWIGLGRVLQYKQTGMCRNDDLHLLRELQTATSFPPAPLDELLHFLE
jgi:hypothetical protein